MIPTTNTDGAPRAPEELRLIERRLNDLIRHVEELTRIVSAGAVWAAVVAPAEVGEKSAARQIDEIERRVGEQERRTASITSLIEGHEKMLRMMCVLLKDLDDPYGMGTGLDERIGLGDAPSDWDECGEPS